MQVGLESVFDFQKDRNVSSSFMGIQVSYLWRPRLDEEFIDAIEKFIDQPPYLIITGTIRLCAIPCYSDISFQHISIHFIAGLGSHHIIKRIIDSPYYHNLEIFEQRMKEFLVPILQRLTAVGTRIIWMNQFPMLGLPLDHKEPDNT